MACHNLLQHLNLPTGTKHLLGLGLNYCLKAPSITATTTHTYKRMIEDIRRMYHLRTTDTDDDYNSRLYIKSDYKFDKASDEIEQAVSTFIAAVKSEQLVRSRARKPQRNTSNTST